MSSKLVLGNRVFVSSLVAPREPMRIECDRDRLYQVLQNLLDNAMKVSPSGETIELRVVESTSDPDFVAVPRLPIEDLE